MSSVARLGEGDIFAGEYQVERVLREGTSPLYAVKHCEDGKLYSLRLLPRSVVQGMEQRKQVLEAAQMSAALSCEHIVKILKSGVESASELPWLLCEPVRGEELESVLRQRGALPQAMVREIFVKLGEALGQAHQAGLVHGALRPRNIWVTLPAEGSGALELQLLDLGLTQLLAEIDPAEGSKSSSVPQWLAPEQTQGRPLVPGTDVWSLGLLGFRLLTGSYYWREANRRPPVPLSILREVMLEQPPQARARAAEYGCADRLPSGFDAWFARCLEPRVAQRFSSAQLAVAALADVFDGKAPPEPAAPIAVNGSAAPSAASGPAPISGPVGSAPAAAPVRRGSTSRSRRLLLLGSGAALVLAFSMSVRVYYGRHDATRRPLDPSLSTVVQPDVRVPDLASAHRHRVDPPSAERTLLRAGPPRSSAPRVVPSQRPEIRAPARNTSRPEPLQRLLRDEPDPRHAAPAPPSELACSHGDVAACLGLNPPEARPVQPKRLTAPAEQGCQAAADCLTQGRTARTGSRPDLTRALRLLTRACELGSGAACLETGRLLRTGEGALADEPRAREYLHLGCERGEIPACQELLPLARQACEAGEARACVQAGRLFESGSGTPRDVGQAAQLFERACHSRDPEGCRRYQALQTQPPSNEV